MVEDGLRMLAKLIASHIKHRIGAKRVREDDRQILCSALDYDEAKKRTERAGS